MGFLAGKRILITGLLSKHSLAYGIAKACHREGAQLAFTYQNERFLDRINKFSAEFGSTLVFQCDVSDDAQIDKVFADLATHWEGLDGLLHSIAYAPTEAIEGDFLDGITREAFRIAHDVSSYSYPALVKAARPLLLKGNKASAPTPFQRVRSRRSLRRVSAISASSWPTIRTMRRCAETSPSTKWATPPLSCSPIWRVPLPAKSCMSMAA